MRPIWRAAIDGTHGADTWLATVGHCRPSVPATTSDLRQDASDTLARIGVRYMDRFFSKLDLRDIKIDPRGTRFPPDEEAYEDHQNQADAPHAAEPPTVDEIAAPPSVQSPSNGVSDGAATYAPEWSPPSSESERANGWDAAPEVSNGHARADAELMPDDCSDVLKVSARSRPSAVAGAIAGVVREAGRAEVQAIGAGATNQAIKAVAIARDYLRETGIEAVCLPAFIDITIDNEDRTAIRLVIEPR